MSVDPDCMTIGDLVLQETRLGIHCRRCRHFVRKKPTDIGIAPSTLLSALKGRFKCRRCGSQETEARPYYGRREKAQQA
jgi:Zn finger protein HypA/HybF involved in hydrogenase expression